MCTWHMNFIERLVNVVIQLFVDKAVMRVGLLHIKEHSKIVFLFIIIQ